MGGRGRLMTGRWQEREIANIPSRPRRLPAPPPSEEAHLGCFCPWSSATGTGSRDSGDAADSLLQPCVFCLLQLVLDSQKRVFSWGFGGYGRLGHAEQKDEMVPRLVKLFDFPGRGASQIYAGYTCSFAVSEVGQ